MASFKDVATLLKDTGNDPVILEGRRPGYLVMLCPRLVGRVMTTSWSGMNGKHLGWIDRAAIEGGLKPGRWINFGGEERFWFAPEGGPFGLFFQDMEQALKHYHVQPGMTSEPYDLVEDAGEHGHATMRSRMRLVNAKGLKIEMEITRTVSILDSCPFTLGTGDRTDFVGFESHSLVKNVGPRPLDRRTGTVAPWTPSIQANGPHQFVLLPYRPGVDEDLGRAIRIEYMPYMTPGGLYPRDRWRVLPESAIFLADGKVCTKVAISRGRAVNRLGSANLDTGRLVINEFDFYPQMEYVSSYYGDYPYEDAYDGDVVSSYLDGPGPGGAGGTMYELETLSPSLDLQPGESFCHRNRVYHVQGDEAAIKEICKSCLRTEWHELEALAKEK